MKGFQFIDYMSQKNQRKNIAHIMNCSNKTRAFNPKQEQYQKITRNRIILIFIACTVIITGLTAILL